MKTQIIKTKILEKILKILKIQKNQFLKAKNSLLELGKDFIKLKGRELKDREVKNKREIEEPSLNRLLCL